MQVTHFDCIASLVQSTHLTTACPNRESGTAEGRELTLQEKSSEFVRNCWVLIFSNALRRWRKGFVVNRSVANIFDLYICIQFYHSILGFGLLSVFPTKLKFKLSGGASTIVGESQPG